MKPTVLCIGPTLGLKYIFQALEEMASFEVKIFGNRSAIPTAIEFAKKHPEEIKVVFVNLDKPLNLLHYFEKEKGQHPFLAAYHRILFFCKKETLSVFVSSATTEPSAFGDYKDFIQPYLFFNLMDTDAIKLAEEIFRKYKSVAVVPAS